jgi:hypothetical protein
MVDLEYLSRDDVGVVAPDDRPLVAIEVHAVYHGDVLKIRPGDRHDIAGDSSRLVFGAPALRDRHIGDHPQT